MFVFDWADIPTTFLKVLLETYYKNALYIFSAANVFCWAYSRLYVFPFVICLDAGFFPFTEFIYTDIPKIPGTERLQNMLKF